MEVGGIEPQKKGVKSSRQATGNYPRPPRHKKNIKYFDKIQRFDYTFRQRCQTSYSRFTGTIEPQAFILGFLVWGEKGIRKSC